MKTRKPNDKKKNDLRKKAEKLFKSNANHIKNMTSADTEKGLNELHVHQLELEMQNEELRKAQLELGALGDKYTELFNFAPVGYVVLNAKNIITEANLKICGMLGVERESLLKKGFSNFISRDSQDVFYLHRKQILETKSQQACELKLRKKNGEEIYAVLECYPKMDTKGNIASVLAAIIDITDRKKSEEKSKENQNLLDKFFNEALDGFFIMMIDEPIEWNENTDKEKVLDYVFANQRITKINDVMLQQYGVKKEDFLNLTPNDLFSQNLKYGKDLWKNMFDEGKIYIDTTEKKLDGSDVMINGNYSCLYDEKGRIIGHFGVQRDITDLKLAEEKIREKDIQFRKLSSNVPDLIFQFTRKPDGTYCVPIASEGIKNIFGCSPEDVREDFSPIARVIYPEDAARVINDIEYSAKHLTYFTCEFRVQIPGKEIQWIYSRSAPEMLPDGSITWYGFNADITERKLAEEKLKTSEEQKKLALQGANLGYWDYKTKTGKAFFDKRWLGMLGYETGDIEQDVKGWAGLIHPDDTERVMKHLNAHFDNPDVIYDVEARLKTKSGNYRWVQCKGKVLVRDKDGKPVRMAGTHMDITELKLAEEKLKTSEERFRLLFENDMSGVALHEIVLDDDGKPIDYIFLMANPAFATHTGGNVAEHIGRRATELYPGIEKTGLIETYGKVALTGEPTSFETYYAPTQKHYSINAFQIGQGRFAVAFVDITESKKAEKELKDNANLNKMLLDSLPHPTMLITRERKIIASNKAARESGAEPGKYCWQGFGHLEYIPPKDKEYVEKHGSQPPDGTKCTFCLADECLDSKGGTNAPEVDAFDKKWDTYWIPLEDEIYLHYAIDITERKQMEKSLKEREEKYRSLVDNLEIGIVMITRDMKIAAINPKVQSWFPEADLSKENICWKVFNVPNNSKICGDECPVKKTFKDGKIHYAERDLDTVDGNKIFRLISTPIKDEGGKITTVIEMLDDITERKKAEDSIRNSLAEKNILLHEIQHRVKNNLQMMNSLINMQTNNLTSSKAKAALTDCNSRIKTMALIHAQLYGEKNMSRVNMREFAATLVASIKEQYLSAETRLSYKIDIKNVILSVSQSNPCGIILNETIVNAMKYAFSDGKAGQLTVSMNRAKNGDISMEIKDNGPGLPAGFDVSKSKSMGFKLIKVLAEQQLRGSYDIKTGARGTTVSVKFNVNETE